MLLEMSSAMVWVGERLLRRMAVRVSIHTVLGSVNLRRPADCLFLANYQSFCYEMKVVQAFSWALFALFTIAFLILLQLVSQAERFGRYNIWSEPIRGPSPFTS